MNTNRLTKENQDLGTWNIFIEFYQSRSKNGTTSNKDFYHRFTHIHNRKIRYRQLEMYQLINSYWKKSTSGVNNFSMMFMINDEQHIVRLYLYIVTYSKTRLLICFVLDENNLTSFLLFDRLGNYWRNDY